MQFADAQMNGEKAMVVKENIPILDLFRKSVDASREALTKVEVRLCDIETSNQRLINDDENHRCVSHEGEITFDNYLRIDNSNKEPDEVARLIKDTFDL